MALIEHTLFGPIDRVKTAIERLKAFEPADGYYLAFSGGKDSCVIKRLADMAGVKHDAHYAVTTIDPPELVRFIKEYHPDVEWVRAEKPLLMLLPDKGFPARMKRWCCERYKEKGGSGRRVLTGIRWAESKKRSNRKMVEVCYTASKKDYLHVIIDWTESDVWDFIRQENVPYCSLYDEGFKRLGCIFCPMQSAWQKRRDRERWPGFEKQFRRAFHKLWDNRKAKGNDSMSKRWKDADECFEWWMSNDPLPSQEDGLFT